MTPESQRVKLWRESNRERYNERQKILMRKKRAEKKAERERKSQPKVVVQKPAERKYTVTIVPYTP